MKKVAMLISSIVLCVALALAILAGVLLPCSIVYAASEKDVVLATISNLEGNEYPVKSAIVLKYAGGEFAIPESYYVTDIKNAFGNNYSVNYCGQSFYLTSDENSALPITKVTFSNNTSPYPDVTLTLTTGTIILKNIPDNPSDSKEIEANSDSIIKFLGYSTDDSSQIFVMTTYDGTSYFGFAKKDAFNAFVVPYHPIAQAERERILESKKPAEPKSGDILPNTSLALRIVLIIGIAVPAVIIVILLFKPSKNDRSSGNNRLRRSRRRDEFDYDSSRSYERSYDERDRRAYDGYNDRNGGYGRVEDDRGYDRDGRDFDDYDRRNGYDDNRR